MKAATRLIASAATEGGIKQMIANYWFASIECISIEGESVFVSGKKRDGARVIVKKGRYRFERELA